MATTHAHTAAYKSEDIFPSASFASGCPCLCLATSIWNTNFRVVEENHFLKSKGHAQNTDDSQYHILDVSHFLGTAKPIIKGDLLILHHRSSTAITATQEKLRVGRSDFFADYSSKKVSSYSGDKLSPLNLTAQSLLFGLAGKIFACANT